MLHVCQNEMLRCRPAKSLSLACSQQIRGEHVWGRDQGDEAVLSDANRKIRLLFGVQGLEIHGEQEWLIATREMVSMRTMVETMCQRVILMPILQQCTIWYVLNGKNKILYVITALKWLYMNVDIRHVVTKRPWYQWTFRVCGMSVLLQSTSNYCARAAT